MTTIRSAAIFCSSLALWTAACAQPSAPSAAASSAAPSERARHDADKVYQMILQHADKTRRAAAPAAAPSAPSQEPVAVRVVTDAPAPRAQPLSALATTGSLEPIAPEASLTSAALPALARSSKLELLSSVEPQFPPRLIRSLGSATVTVKFQVRTDGTVSLVEVTRSPHRGLNEAAITAVSAWRFRPIAEPASGVVDLKIE
jgi:TonB family protein